MLGVGFPTWELDDGIVVPYLASSQAFRRSLPRKTRLVYVSAKDPVLVVAVIVVGSRAQSSTSTQGSLAVTSLKYSFDPGIGIAKRSAKRSGGWVSSPTS